MHTPRPGKRLHHTSATIGGSKGRALPSTHSEQLLDLGYKSLIQYLDSSCHQTEVMADSVYPFTEFVLEPSRETIAVLERQTPSSQGLVQSCPIPTAPCLLGPAAEKWLLAAPHPAPSPPSSPHRQCA